MATTLASPDAASSEPGPPAETSDNGAWPEFTAYQIESMDEDQLLAVFYQKVDALRAPGGARVRPSSAHRNLRYRILTSYVDPRHPEEQVKSAVGLVLGRNGWIRIELRDFGAHVDGGDILTEIRIRSVTKGGGVEHCFYDDAGDPIDEQDSQCDVLLDALGAVDSIHAARRQDGLREHDLTGLFRSRSLTEAGKAISWE